jgi:hypothetical protein
MSAPVGNGDVVVAVAVVVVRSQLRCPARSDVVMVVVAAAAAVAVVRGQLKCPMGNDAVAVVVVVVRSQLRCSV